MPVVCKGDRQAVLFPRALLAARPTASSRPSAGNASDRDLLRSTAPAEDFAGSVRQAVAALFLDGYPGIQVTAEAVGLSVRTLQRRLSEAGESYQQLAEGVRLETGTRLLRDTDAKLIDIAWELGYADPANFTRAFRRWTGMAPRAFRHAETTELTS